MKKSLKILSMFCIVSIVFCGIYNVYGDALSDYQKQFEEIKKEQQANKEKLNGLDKEIAQDLYDMTNLDSKITDFSTKLTTLQKKVVDVNSKLEEQEKALQNSAQTYNSAEELYTTRLKIIYENGIPSMIDVFLSSQNISDFFSKMNVLNSILEYDKSLVDNMKNQKEYIDNIKNNIELQKAQLDLLTYDTEKSTKALEDARVAKENKMNDMKSSKETLKAKAIALQKQEAESARKIQEEAAKLENNGNSFNGQFTWPVPGFNVITTRFNVAYDPWDTGYTTVHTGCDIAGSGIASKKIIAMESGTVTIARWYGGYGNCVMIDHGVNTTDEKRYKSLYGHANSLNVTLGQKVK
ncbi:MAG: peptidoglycan DD-metalloendopeptidase family protein, partial [Clostridia bacterium]